MKVKKSTPALSKFRSRLTEKRSSGWCSLRMRLITIRRKLNLLAARQPAWAAQSATRYPAELMFIRQCVLPAAETPVLRLKKHCMENFRRGKSLPALRRAIRLMETRLALPPDKYRNFMIPAMLQNAWKSVPLLGRLPKRML